MPSSYVTGLVVVLCMLAGTGCNSEADRQYAKCLELEKQGRLLEALGACRNAELDEPASGSGQKAHRKGLELKKKLAAKTAAQDRRFKEFKKKR